MRRSQTFAALAAVVLAAASLLPLAPSLRIACAALAVLIVVAVLAGRVRMHAARRTKPSGFDAYARAQRIRAERAKRMRR